MNNKKGLFVDLDGTLLNDERVITAGNREAIDRALKAGHSIVISTGRPLASAIKQAKKLDLMGPGCYISAYNGGVYYDCGKGEIIKKTTIPLPVIYRLFDEADRRNIHIQTYTDTKVVGDSKARIDYLEKYCAKILMEYETIQDIRELKEEPVKCLMVDYDTREYLYGAQEWIRSECPELNCFFSCKEYLEIIPSGADKGVALRDMASLLGISEENTVSAGDEANDIPMLHAAKVGVCMINGRPEVKEVADYITVNDNNHDGIKEVIEKFILN